MNGLPELPEGVVLDALPDAAQVPSSNPCQRFIPLAQAQPSSSNPFDQFGAAEPAKQPSSVSPPDWVSCFLTLAQRLDAQQNDLLALRQTVCNQAAALNAHTNLLASMVRLLARYLSAEEIEAAMMFPIEVASGMLPPELVAMFRMTIATVKSIANVGDAALAPAVH